MSVIPLKVNMGVCFALNSILGDFAYSPRKGQTMNAITQQIVNNLNNSIMEYDRLYSNYLLQLKALCFDGRVEKLSAAQAQQYQEIKEEAEHCLFQIGVATRRLAELGGELQTRQSGGMLVELARKQAAQAEKPAAQPSLTQRLFGKK